MAVAQDKGGATKSASICDSLPIGNDFSVAHPGVDYDVPIGRPVFAPVGGSVRAYKWNVSYGYHVYLFSGPWTFLYAHLSVISVIDHHAIQPGALIGLTGSTGHSTGPHLHYGVTYLGVPVNPHSMPCPFVQSSRASTLSKPTATGKLTAGDVLRAATAQGNLGAEVATTRRFSSHCIPPKSGGFWSHVPIINIAQAGVKDTTYAICILTDVNTYIRIAMVLFGAILLTKGTIDFSKVLSPALSAQISKGASAVTGAAKMAVAA